MSSADIYFLNTVYIYAFKIVYDTRNLISPNIRGSAKEGSIGTLILLSVVL